MKHFVQMASFDAKLLFILHFIRSTLSACFGCNPVNKVSVQSEVPISIIIIPNSTTSLFTESIMCTQPQQPEINDQFNRSITTVEAEHAVDEAPNKVENLINFTTNDDFVKSKIEKDEKPRDNRKYLIAHNEVIEVDSKPSYLDIIYEILTRPINNFLSSTKVSFVLRNVGTCVVNGVMEIISHYLPAPFIPLIASAAGMVIPFEPVVMLKEKMPVTSYRRAFGKAMKSFLNTFDAYKLDSFDDDPYMTRRFNRRFMNDISGEKEKKNNNID